MTKLIIPMLLTMLVTPAFSQTIAELERRARRGDTEAQVALGKRHERGDGTLQNYFEAVKWYRAAAEQGDPMGQLNLGPMYLYGRGVYGRDVSENRRQAHIWCNLAASKLTGEDQDRALRCRNGSAHTIPRMSTKEINEAHRLARQWKPRAWDDFRSEGWLGITYEKEPKIE